MIKHIFNNYYVGIDGQVYYLDRPLKPSWRKSRSGKKYITFRMYKDGKVITEYAHRIVARAFHGNIEGLTVDHLDGNPENNHAENLEIVTMKENCHRKIRVYIRKSSKIVRFAWTIQAIKSI